MEKRDVVLVGAGVMSATLAVLLRELEPGLSVAIVESLDAVAGESSDAWNNAGTGHAALCELNYTPQRPDGSIAISKALEINEAFEVSRQFWSYLVTRGILENPGDFIRTVPHLSFVHGAENIAFLRKRFEALCPHHCFGGMEYSEDPSELAEWMPLVMKDRDPAQRVAATRVDTGTDVDFGALTRALAAHLEKQDGVEVHRGHRVTNVSRLGGARWKVDIRRRGGAEFALNARFVFLGAGGGALPLLQKSGISEGRGFGGFPVSGQWLRCDDPVLVARHHAKVYGLASVGSPPMSVPHLDTRVVNGRKSLLFGPYAGFSTRFLKSGSLLDLPLSIKPDNLVPMLAAGRDNMDLTRYLIGQVLQSPGQRLETLREFLPAARREDWKLAVAGQRVQIIKKHPVRGGILQFGTEVVAAADGSLAALLGASPGASTSVAIMLHLIRKCFPNRPDWKARIAEMIPSDGHSLAHDRRLYERLRPWTDETLGLAGERALVA
jgi:malate dehydrogenase (quinone)